MSLLQQLFLMLDVLVGAVAAVSVGQQRVSVRLSCCFEFCVSGHQHQHVPAVMQRRDDLHSVSLHFRIRFASIRKFNSV